MTRICIFSSHRAERGLLQPLIDRLHAHPGFDLDLFSLAPESDFAANYTGARNRLMTHRPDVVVVPCDRHEALAGAIASFGLNLPIVHFHAGDVGTWSADETHRHVISLMASVHLCNGPTARATVCDLLGVLGRSIERVYDTGSTVSDDVDPDISSCPDGPFDLVLYHPPNNDTELIKRELDEIEETLSTDAPVVWVYPNGDEGSAQIIQRIEEVQHRPEMRVLRFKDMPRKKFLGLMSECRMFTGNSSSMVLEAPIWLYDTQIVHIGDRNRNRSFDEISSGGTDKIIKVLEGIDWKNDFKIGAHPK